jgi:hypothetical protein
LTGQISRTMIEVVALSMNGSDTHEKPRPPETAIDRLWRPFPKH